MTEQSWKKPRGRIVAYTLCLKKDHTFKLSVTSLNLNRFSKCLHSWRAHKFTTRNLHSFSPHLDYVATTFGSQKSNFVKNYKRYYSKIVPYVIKIKHYMSYGYKDINTITPVAHVFIIFWYTWSKMTSPLVNCIASYAAVKVKLSVHERYFNWLTLNDKLGKNRQNIAACRKDRPVFCRWLTVQRWVLRPSP